MLIQAMALPPVAAVNDIRIDLPLAMMAERPGIETEVFVSNAKLRDHDGPKIFLWHRPIHTRDRAPDQIRSLLRRGYLIVVEFDDDPGRWPDIAANDHLTFRAAHGVQTSTHLLAAKLRQWNPEVAVFPNGIADLPAFAPRPAGGEVVLFFGALNRMKDWPPIMPALNRVLAEASRPVRVEVVGDQGFFDALETERKRFTPVCGYPDYRARLQSADIALMPLADSPFRRMKSDLKFIEAAAAGAVTLASTVLYSATVEDGRTGILFDTPESFAEKLAGLIADDAARRQIAEAAYAYVRDCRQLAPQAEARLMWYWSLADRAEALTRDLVARTPEIAA